MIFDKFILLNQGDLSAHCFYRFSTSNVSQTEMQQHIDFLMEISVKKNSSLANLMKTQFSKAAFNDQNTFLVSHSHFLLSHV